MKALTDLRDQIDRVDADLIRLFEERLRISEAIAQVKAVHHTPVLDPEREARVLARAEALVSPENRADTLAFMRALMAFSKLRQRPFMGQRTIVFIGLPGSGKTTLSRRVAEALSLPWFDSDQQIEAMEGLTIPQIFAQRGEAHFRTLETACLSRLCRVPGIVLAAGGGAPLENGPLLRENTLVIYLRRTIPDILSTLPPDTRPLLKDPSQLYALHETRQPLYESLSTLTVDNTGSIDHVTQTILEALRCISSSSTGPT